MIEKAILDDVERGAKAAGFRITGTDLDRPWGGSLYIDEGQAAEFAAHYFSEAAPAAPGRLSPKLLIVAPGERLSWQYHHRRSERWHVLRGPVAAAVSQADDEPSPRPLAAGEEIEIAEGERHRLIGTADWGVVAEIWRHTDAAQPSDENDIVRLQDDYHRGTP